MVRSKTDIFFENNMMKDHQLQMIIYKKTIISNSNRFLNTYSEIFTFKVNLETP